jgi:hypothetical protein
LPVRRSTRSTVAAKLPQASHCTESGRATLGRASAGGVSGAGAASSRAASEQERWPSRIVAPVLLLRKYFAGAVAMRSPWSNGAEQITQIPKRSDGNPSSFGFILDHFFLQSDSCAAQDRRHSQVRRFGLRHRWADGFTVRRCAPLGTRHSHVRRWSPVGPATRRAVRARPDCGFPHVWGS